MAFERTDPSRPEARWQELRVAERSQRLAVGTLACPRCDSPVAPAGPVSPAAPLVCPFCDHTGFVRDFLSLALPTRPARVEVRVVARGVRVSAAR
jgi:hypothetical protein